MSSQQLFATRPQEDESDDLIDNMNFDDLDITNAMNDNIDFEEIDGLMEKFKEDSRVQEILEQEMDVREYSQNVEKMLDAAEKKSVEDYVNQQQDLVELHREIKSCDSILESMESILYQFQSDLGNISDEIRSLQDQSSTMSIKLQNRKSVAEELHEFIQNISVPNKLIKQICQEKIDESMKYFDYLDSLESKIKFSQQQGKQIAATKDIDPELEKLRIKAISRVREKALDVVYTEFRKPNTNIQMLQDKNRALMKRLNEFLMRYGQEYAKEVRIAYIDTVQKIYFAHFREYIAALMRLHSEIGSKNDLLGVEENQGKGFFSSKFSKNRTSVFTMGAPPRDDILCHLEDDCIVPHEAQAKNQTFAYDVLFRNMIYYFKSAVTFEDTFDTDFFSQKVDLFQHIFGKSIPLFVENVTNYAASSFDALGLLIMIRIAKHYAISARAAEIPKLEAFMQSLIEILSPRFFTVFSMHLESIRNADPRVLGAPDPTKIGGLGPHYVTRRYAEFTSAIHSLNPEGNQAMNTKLAALRTQMQKLILRLAAPLQTIPKLPPIRCKQKQVIFLLNNVDQVLSIYSNKKLDVEDAQKWKALMDQQVGTFVEVELLLHFEKLVRYTKEAQKTIEQNGPESFQWDPAKAKEVAINFSDTFQANIDKIVKNIRDWISNLLTGAEILQQTLSTLLNYYTQFDTLVRRHTQDQSVIKELVTVGKLTHYLKKCKLI